VPAGATFQFAFRAPNQDLPFVTTTTADFLATVPLFSGL